MVLQKYKIDVILNLVFIILGHFVYKLYYDVNKLI